MSSPNAATGTGTRTGTVPGAVERALLVDVGGVLVRDYLPGAAAAWGPRFGLTPREFLAALYDGNDAGVLVGRVSEDAWWTTVGERLGARPAVVAALRRDLDARETWDGALVGRLRRLRGTPGVRTAIVSNTWPRLRTRMARAGLLDVVDHLVLSCEVGCAKPDARIFELALRGVGADPAQALFIDDTPGHVDAARALGLAGHVHTRAKDTLTRIEEFLGGG
ncbi:HAD-IA family hydrolase [Streptomyces sp. NPDC059063]|uniref:HAD-IA family hydrolase n=1 Tax=unclassified Streptomyces TaxID=2593676 RepID=UPI0036838667